MKALTKRENSRNSHSACLGYWRSLSYFPMPVQASSCYNSIVQFKTLTQTQLAWFFPPQLKLTFLVLKRRTGVLKEFIDLLFFFFYQNIEFINIWEDKIQIKWTNDTQSIFMLLNTVAIGPQSSKFRHLQVLRLKGQSQKVKIIHWSVIIWSTAWPSYVGIDHWPDFGSDQIGRASCRERV